MSNQDRSNTTKKSTVYVALITALAIIIGSVILGLGGQTTPQEPTPEAAPAVELPNAGITESNKATISFTTNQGEIVIARALEKCEQEFLKFTNLNRK